MFDKFKRWIARDIIQDLDIYIQELEDQLMEDAPINVLNPEPDLPRFYMNKLIEGGAQWYDYTELDASLLDEYKRRAELLRTNDVFQNEINFIINTYAKRALTEAKTAEDIRDFRMQCLALADLRTRINEIPKPKAENEVATDPNSAI